MFSLCISWCIRAFFTVSSAFHVLVYRDAQCTVVAHRTDPVLAIVALSFCAQGRFLGSFGTHWMTIRALRAILWSMVFRVLAFAHHIKRLALPGNLTNRVQQSKGYLQRSEIRNFSFSASTSDSVYCF